MIISWDFGPDTTLGGLGESGPQQVAKANMKGSLSLPSPKSRIWDVMLLQHQASKLPGTNMGGRLSIGAKEERELEGSARPLSCSSQLRQLSVRWRRSPGCHCKCLHM